MKIKRNFILVFLFATPIFSQENLGSWNILNMNLKINSKWNVFGETQIRSLSFYDEFHYYEIKAGGTYKIDKDFSATSGFGSYNTFSEGGNFKEPIRNKEIRSWLQINLKNRLQFFMLEHRYRAEQRFTSKWIQKSFPL
jgi:Protein of unknown function (DUF2490)